MTNIFNRIASKRQDERTAARDDYLRLLTKLNLTDDSAADEAELARLIDLLGISIERVEQDHSRIQSAMDELAISARVDQTAAAMEATAAKFDEACAARQSAYHEQNLRVAVAAGERDSAAADHERAQNARRAINELERTDAAMLAIVRDAISRTKNRK